MDWPWKRLQAILRRRRERQRKVMADAMRRSHDARREHQEATQTLVRESTKVGAVTTLHNTAEAMGRMAQRDGDREE